jgi:glycosyltransferase involved in cell wall biosynthesis
MIARMKVIHLESGRYLYGGARQVELLLAGLSRDVESVLLCRPGAELAESASRAGVRVIELPWRGDLDLSAVGRLRRVLRAERPDVLHVHSRSGADLYGGLAARAEAVPAVVTRRVDQREPVRWARTKLGRFARVVAISTAIRDWLVGEVAFTPHRVVVIPSAVEAARFAPSSAARRTLEARFDLDHDCAIIGAVGQLIARKGHDVLLAALPEIIARVPQAHCLIFGRGPLRRRLEAEIAQRGLAARVRLVGYDATLAQMLAGLDVLVHPARAEGLGLAVLEASSCGVPVVASRAGGLVDAVVDGTTGRLVPPGDAAALAAATVELLHDAPLRRMLGAHGRARMRAHHSIEAMTRAYLRVYTQLGLANAGTAA